MTILDVELKAASVPLKQVVVVVQVNSRGRNPMRRVSITQGAAVCVCVRVCMLACVRPRA